MVDPARLSRLLGRPVERVEPRRGAGGWTPALRLRVHLADGTTAFAKVPTTEMTVRMLEAEVAAYERLDRQPWAPTVLAAGDGVLVLEDLSSARWPPPWQPGDVERVVATMAEVAAARPDGLPTLEELRAKVLRQWQHVDVDALVGKGLDRRWLDEALPVLVEVDQRASFAGDDLLHLDLRSDNLCFDSDRVVLVDWNGACRGPAALDLVCWAPSLRLEGGPEPWDLLPDADLAHVSMISGFFAQRCPLPEIPDGMTPAIRRYQEAQMRVAVRWVARLLDLGEPFRP